MSLSSDNAPTASLQAVIHSVQPGSIAEDLELTPGTRIVAINGNSSLEDQLDYQYEVLGTEDIELHIAHPNGDEEIIEIEKDADDDLGIVFTSPIFTPIKTCNNACPFCFIDQQPAGLRPTLYVKDDDWRLSYFTQTYITLTNLAARDRERIETIRPGPLYVSVHATEPAIRIQMLNNPKFGGNIMEDLGWLQSIGVPFHAQVVVCPGINDGAHLTQTLTDLATFMPECLSVAVIPVGLTQYREGLPQLSSVDTATAKDVVARVQDFWQHHPNTEGVVFMSDEFYHKAGMPLPSYESYGEFDVLEDGVGTARMLSEGFFELEHTLPASITPFKKVLILTGKLAAMTLAPIVQRLNEIDGLYVDILTVDSQFWGQQVDVAGLITGQDILNACQTTDVSGYDQALIPSVMLKQDTENFLDDTTVGQVSTQIGVPISVVTDPYDAQCLLDTLGLVR